MDPVLLTSMVKLSVLVMVNGQDVIVQVSMRERSVQEWSSSKKSSFYFNSTSNATFRWQSNFWLANTCMWKLSPQKPLSGNRKHNTLSFLFWLTVDKMKIKIDFGVFMKKRGRYVKWLQSLILLSLSSIFFTFYYNVNMQKIQTKL